MMSRARRWIAVVAVSVLAGCASSGAGGETSATEDVLWTLFYVVTFIAGVIGARLLVEHHRRQ